MKLTICIPVLTALALTGCVSTTSPNLSDSHPANPHAPPSPVAAAPATLVAGAQGLVLPASTNQTEMQHEHHQTPANKAAQKPAEHEHQQEQPKKEEKK